MNTERITESNNVVDHTQRNEAGSVRSFADTAWESNLHFYEEVRHSPFISQMADATLNPNGVYGPNMNQTLYREFHIRYALDSALSGVDQSEEPELYNRLLALYNQYFQYNPEDWHVSSSDPFVGTSNSDDFNAWVVNVASEHHPIYLIFGLIPNMRIRSQVTNDVSIEGFYSVWSENNRAFEGEVVESQNFVDAWISEGKDFDEDFAADIYNQFFQFETLAYLQALETSKLVQARMGTHKYLRIR